MRSRSVVGLKIRSQPYILTIVALLSVLPFGLTQQTDEPYIVEPTPALNFGDEDLTTVLLVNNNNRTEDHGGFYMNIRPNVGLLTSTARTFIQEGVTTEYATQVLGTTLENGRIYAQLLKKSSRVLYEKNSAIAPSGSSSGGVVHTSIVGEGPNNQNLFAQPRKLLQSHNDLVADKDWQDVDDKLVLVKESFVGNTDYIGGIPRRSQIVFPVKGQSDRDESAQQKLKEQTSLQFARSSTVSSDSFKIKANKVQPAVDLPTFTIKNMFSPSGFSWDSPSFDGAERQSIENKYVDKEHRSPKLLYQQVMKEEQRALSTITYYGFADFTTVVGDSVIVFSPSTSTDKAPVGQVTSIKGEATLGRQVTTYVQQHVVNTVSQNFVKPTLVVPTFSTAVIESNANKDDFDQLPIKETKEDEEESTDSPSRPMEVELNFGKQEILTNTDVEEISEEQTSEENTTQYREENVYVTMPQATEDDDTSDEKPPNQYEEVLLVSSITDISSTPALKSEEIPETTSKVLLSRPSDEEILRIYSSLAQAEAAKKLSEMSTTIVDSSLITENVLETPNSQKEANTTTKPSTTTEEAIQPDIQIQGGATTIFFEDDPFLDFVSPSSTTETSAFQSTQSAVITTPEPISERSETKPFDPTTEPVTEMPETEPTVEISTEENPEVARDYEENKEENTSKTIIDETFKPIVKEIDENDQADENCIRTSQVFLTQIPKTLTYFTTFFIPNEDDEYQTSTSIETNIVPSFDITEATKHYCIQPTRAVEEQQHTTTVAVLERPLKPEESNVVDSDADVDESEREITTPMIMVRENAEVTEAENVEEEASGDGYDEDEDTDEEQDDQEFGDEIELIYKTLYTTYTYLTTFFHDSTTSVSSRKEVVTNIVTSSMDFHSISSTEIGDIESSIAKTPSIEATPVLSQESVKFTVQSSDLVKIDDILREDSDSDELKPTLKLDESNIAKTFFTTYTYYTTIFVDGETEIMNRTEVHTNIVGKTSSDSGISPSARNLQIDDIVSDEDNAVIDIRPTATYDTIQRTALATNELLAAAKEKDIQSKYKTLIRGALELESSSSSSSFRSEKKIVPIGDHPNMKIITDTKSNGGDQQAVNDNGVFEDQISSESNTDEIIPSATLLLQTSFTTFTYYTTMYSSDATNVISRLETITNVVTETLQPTKTISAEEATLPITYFTTFTYWTKLAKEGEITTLSREETVSNIVTPSLSELSDSSIVPTTSSSEQSLSTNEVHVTSNEDSLKEVIEETHSASPAIEPTTYYTTYTYYTTSYAGDQTITDSRFETITNVVTPTSASVESSETTEKPNNEVDSSKEQKLEIDSTSSVLIPDQTISFDYKTIVDAEGISTLYFRTELLATSIDGTSSEVLFSTSSINVDEIKKALLPTTPVAEGTESTRTYKTGLVRLIDGTKFLNHTTTVYQSKVIGTIIDQRYAQIIESTSSFIIEKTQSPVVEISASSTQSPTEVLQTAFVGDSSDKPIESSISDGQNENENEGEQQQGEDEAEDEDEDNEGGRPRTRLSFQTKKKTFTPVIRPFASRNRPQFAPKRNNILQSSATIITRSDFTPTITATPAIKSESRGRFSSLRKSNPGYSSSGISGSSSQSGKRFGRPSKSSGGYGSSSSSFPGSSRNRIQSSRGGIQSSSSAYGGSSSGGFASTRRSGSPFRGSSTNTRSFSSAYPGNSRLRIRPTNSLSYENPNTAGYTTLPPESGEDEGVTQKYESDEENDFTTENLRRNNNPLLRFRRPQVNRPPFGQQIGQRSSSAGGQVSPRRNPLTQKPRTTTTTSTTTTTPRPRPGAFQRPSLGSIQNRSRPQSNLFPPRRLFQPQNVNQAIDEEQRKPGDDFSDTENEENDSSEYENDEENDEQEDQNRRRRESFPKLLSKKRSKRQANNFRNRFRRPSTTKPSAEDRVDDPTDEEPSTIRSRTTSRYTPRSHSLPSTSSSKAQHNTNNRAIRPTKPNSNNRAQFTLREKETTSKHPSRVSTNFRRPTPNGVVSSRRTTTAASRPKSPRLKNYGSTVTESPHSSSPRGRTPTSRSRSSARGRSRNDFTTDPITPAFDGTITVTHTSPTEITIPVVNGKVTEYKNVLTSTTSTEVLLPNQYTSIVGPLGSSTLVLNREDTSVNANGATEVTQFILHESPTTTVVFTPTTIRGRKTSFAHMIPSTAYQVENVVSTMQAQIAANAPLANILLSQLLLGNLGSLNQPNINPLLALGGAATQPASQVPGVPVTEYKTRSSTYVTTVTNGMSTVIPLTFHGKEILTTIYDSSSDVITATEYITETIIVTPTQQAQQNQQVNSLLLPYLLQQQLQGQPSAQPALPIQNSIPPQLLLPDNLQDLDSNGIQKYNDYGQDIDDYVNNNQDELIEAPAQNQRSNNGNRKKNRKSHKQHTPAAAPVFESSVITLYVSGRRPGEFSTVLSTVQIGQGESTLHKRQISRPQAAVFRSITSPNGNDDYEDYYRSAGSEIEEYLLPASNDIGTSASSQSLKNNFLSEETQSLESIVGDVGLWYAKTSAHLDQLPNREQSTIYDSNQSSSSSSSSNEILSSTNDLKDPDPSSQSKYFLV